MQPSSRDHRLWYYERIVTRIRLNAEGEARVEVYVKAEMTMFSLFLGFPERDEIIWEKADFDSFEKSEISLHDTWLRVNPTFGK